MVISTLGELAQCAGCPARISPEDLSAEGLCVDCYDQLPIEAARQREYQQSPEVKARRRGKKESTV